MEHVTNGRPRLVVHEEVRAYPTPEQLKKMREIMDKLPPLNIVSFEPTTSIFYDVPVNTHRGREAREPYVLRGEW